MTHLTKAFEPLDGIASDDEWNYYNVTVNVCDLIYAYKEGLISLVYARAKFKNMIAIQEAVAVNLGLLEGATPDGE